MSIINTGVVWQQLVSHQCYTYSPLLTHKCYSPLLTHQCYSPFVTHPRPGPAVGDQQRTVSP